MNALIIEDETAALRNLTALLEELRPQLQIVGTTDSIESTIEWFTHHSQPDIVFMDIHLADGSAFEIFNHVGIICPIIFTTAYDEYALRAFRVNSIDYLLKPIEHDDMERALAKFDHFSSSDSQGINSNAIRQLIEQLGNQKTYKANFLIPTRGDKLLPVPTDMILLFYIDESLVKAVLSDGHEYTLPLTLDEVTDSVDPARFFRINRQCLLSREAVRDIDLWFNHRLAINLTCKACEGKVLVSKARVQAFKDWFSSASSRN